MNQHAATRNARAVLALALLALGACGDEPRPPLEPAPVTSPPSPPSPTPVQAPAPEPEPTSDELPVPDDFAAEAEQTIDDESYRAELDALEKELSAEAATAPP